MTDAESNLHALLERLANAELGAELVSAVVAVVDERLVRAGVRLPIELPLADEQTAEHCRDLVQLAQGAGARERVLAELQRQRAALLPAQFGDAGVGRAAARALARQVIDGAPSPHLPRAAWAAVLEAEICAEADAARRGVGS